MTEPNTRSVAVAPLRGMPASERLYAQLAPADVAAVEAALEGSERAYWEQVDDNGRKQLALVYGTWHRIPAVLEKTGLRAEMPPEDVHAMARGPLAAGGAVYYADLLGSTLARVGGIADDVRRGLDFGCSSGRVVRALAAAWPQAEWHGCDPNEGAIAWAREHLPGIEFLRSPQDPPLPYDDGAFDFVCAISIWSHYGEQAAIAWLDEMHRIVAPGGRLLLTTHGLQSVAYYAHTGERAPAQLERIRAAIYRTGFWFADEFGAEGDWGVKHPQWGTAFFTPEWLARRAPPAGSSRTSRSARTPATRTSTSCAAPPIRRNADSSRHWLAQKNAPIAATSPPAAIADAAGGEARQESAISPAKPQRGERVAALLRDSPGPRGESDVYAGRHRRQHAGDRDHEYEQLRPDLRERATVADQGRDRAGRHERQDDDDRTVRRGRELDRVPAERREALLDVGVMTGMPGPTNRSFMNGSRGRNVCHR